jgi:uncharacterized protein
MSGRLVAPLLSPDGARPLATVGRVYAIELVFDASQEEGRLAVRPAHREYLAGLHADGRLVMAGPWDDDTGALLIFDTDEDGLKEILDGDPYYRAPGVTIASTRVWAPIFTPR